MKYCRQIIFDGNQVEIRFEQQQLDELLQFLFADLAQDHAINPPTESVETFEIHQRDDHWKLFCKEKSLYSGKNIAGLGVILMGEVLFHLIRENDTALAIHAGLVSKGEHTTMLPGNSGSGKSSVTTWMTAHGWNYHTDELVAIDLESRNLKAFTRPLSIKTPGVAAIGKIIDLDAIAQKLQVSADVTMIPHRLINPDFSPSPRPITHIIFPKYIPESDPELIELSGAEAGLDMMRSNVIARNLPNHGFGQVIQLVRNLPAYRLHYRHFDDLPQLMDKIYKI